MSEDVWKRRLARQRRRVELLEQLIEDKTRELFLANQRLQQSNTHLEERVKERTQALQDALSRAEAADLAKTRFLAQMSHELRTPLHGMLGTIDVLSYTKLTHRQKELLTLTHRSSNHLMVVINDILDYTKLEEGEMALDLVATDPGQLLEEVIEDFLSSASSKGLTLQITSRPETIGVEIDQHRMRQILSNVISNAIKFTTTGGVELRLTVDALSPEEVQLQWSVRDTGIGISPKHQANIFEPFKQADSSTARTFGGTGLGLAICRRLIDIMGGEILLESQPGEGTTITIITPHKVAFLAPKAASKPTPSFENIDVLLVDDNRINRVLGRDMLSLLGCSPRLASNGYEAIEQVKQAPPALIFMDCHMPRMSGAETSKVLRAQGYGGPIIALSADISLENKEEVIAAGMQELMGKPYHLTDLAQLISTWTSATPSHQLSPKQPPQDATLDIEQAVMAVGGNKALIKELLALFLTQLPIMMDAVRAAMDDPKAQHRAAHSLKGSSASIYATRLSQHAGLLEESGKQGICRPDLLGTLEELAQETTAAIQAELT